MKTITVEIPIDEALAGIGTIQRIKEFTEKSAQKTSGYQYHTGILSSLEDRIYSAVISQATLEEINEVKDRGK